MKLRSHKEDKLAKLYDADILPVWSRRFGRLLLRDLALPPKAMVLDVACGTGYPALEILRKLDAESRIIAIDASSPMLDEARVKAGRLSGKRIFFRSETATPKLAFADDVYDMVVCNAALDEIEDPEQAIQEFARVTKPGGRVVVTMPLGGTFGEFHDLFREVLAKLDHHEALDRLEAYLARYPPLEQLEAWFEDAGLVDLKTEYDTFTLLFKSSREFFFAPVIEYGPLNHWKAIAGKGQKMQDVFWHAKEAIDAYFQGRPFAVTVHAGCVRGRKQTLAEARANPRPVQAVVNEAPTEREPAAPNAVIDDDEVPTGEVELVTGDFDVIEGEKVRERLELDGVDDDESEEPIL
jgi:ubiquinone/menaquinone biosynthesis C-methylase UbiE